MAFIKSQPYGRRRQWQPTPVLLPGKPHGQQAAVHGVAKSWTRLSDFHFSLSCIGEGNGNPLQCSCLENPRDGGAWWAAVYGVVQSWTRLKKLSSSSRNSASLLIQYMSSTEDKNLYLHFHWNISKVLQALETVCFDLNISIRLTSPVTLGKLLNPCASLSSSDSGDHSV